MGGERSKRGIIIIMSQPLYEKPPHAMYKVPGFYRNQDAPTNE